MSKRNVNQKFQKENMLRLDFWKKNYLRKTKNLKLQQIKKHTEQLVSHSWVEWSKKMTKTNQLDLIWVKKKCYYKIPKRKYVKTRLL